MRWRAKQNVFVCYRRSDTSEHAQRLHDALAARLGRDRVFTDPADTPAGSSFLDVVTQSLSRADVLLVVIGRSWLNAADETGENRLDSTTDYVRREVEVALARGARIMPVLVDGARMPPAEVLP